MSSYVFNRDCLEAMREFPTGFFDLAVVDPPYGIGYDRHAAEKAGEQCGNAAARKKTYHATGWDNATSPPEYFAELFRVSKNAIIWGGNYYQLPPSKCFICWDKRTTDNMKNDFADAELAWCSPALGVARVFRYVWNGMIQGDMSAKENRIHPTQKPVALYRWIFKNYASAGAKILDTHLGSGSSRIAAYDAGLDFWGYEIDEVYFKLEEERFAAHAAQINLFLDY